MDPVLMAGAWAGAILAVVAAANVMYRAFLKAVKGAVTDEFTRVWLEFDEQDRWQVEQWAEMRKEMKELRADLSRLEKALGERVS